MALKKLFAQSMDGPAEYEATEPVECHFCGRVWDAEDQGWCIAAGPDNYDYCDPSIRSCLIDGQRQQFTESLKERVLPQLIEARITLAEIHKRHGGLVEGSDWDIYDELQSLIEEVEQA